VAGKGSNRPEQETLDIQLEVPGDLPEVAERKKLVNVLSQHSGVKEFALFDSTGFLENRNEGDCQVEDIDPALFLMGVERLEEFLQLGSFSHMIMHSASRSHCLLFKLHQHRVVARLVKGQRPAEVMKQVQLALKA
jgi:hypothetical protein